MNYNFYSELMERIHQQVPEIKSVGEDLGQFDVDDRPAVRMPCVLLNLSYENCTDTSRINQLAQLVDANLSVRLGFDVRNERVNEFNKVRLAIVEKLHKALQGWRPTSGAAILSRENAKADQRVATKLYETNYSTKISTN